jgi:hypothetical protein
MFTVFYYLPIVSTPLFAEPHYFDAAACRKKWEIDAASSLASLQESYDGINPESLGAYGSRDVGIGP